LLVASNTVSFYEKYGVLPIDRQACTQEDQMAIIKDLPIAAEFVNLRKTFAASSLPHRLRGKSFTVRVRDKRSPEPFDRLKAKSHHAAP
jgi:hypothetical protein